MVIGANSRGDKIVITLDQ